MSKDYIKILIICLIGLVAIGTVVAAEANQTDDVSVSGGVPVDMDEQLETDDYAEAVSQDASADMNESSYADDAVGISGDENEVLGDYGSYNDFNDKYIAADTGGTIDLEKDYKFTYFNLAKQITVDGHGYTIDGNGGQIFKITSRYKVTLKNIKFTNAGSTYVIQLGDFGSYTYYVDLINCTFYNKQQPSSYVSNCYGALYGYGIMNLNIVDCTFVNGSGSNYGRVGYFLKGGNINITNSTFDSNYNKYSGGNYYAGGSFWFASDYSSTVNIVNSTFRNARSTYGGAFYFSHSSKVTIKNSTFNGHSAGTSGGAIYFAKTGNLVIENSTFENNYAAYNGGAIYFASTGNLEIENSTFENNYAAATSSSTSTRYGGGCSIFCIYR